MLDIYGNWASAWLAFVRHGSKFASELNEARRLMLADPNYDEARYRAALLAADAVKNGSKISQPCLAGPFKARSHRVSRGTSKVVTPIF